MNVHASSTRRSSALRRLMGAWLRPLARRAAKAYVAGESLDSAVALARQLHARGQASTIGYWNSDEEPVRQVAAEYCRGIERLAGEGAGGYLSIKLPALGFDPAALDEIAACAQAHNVRLHCDSLAPETVDQTQCSIDHLLSTFPGLQLGYTLPGRWARSPRDADWASERSLPVRVVKGQWTDPLDPQLDPAAGFLSVIDRLAGRAAHVSIASHNVDLATAAWQRLQSAGTPADWELLYGLPRRAALRAAESLGVTVRVYVPYGASYLPYAVAHALHNPRIAWWLLKDAIASPLAAVWPARG